MVLAANQKQSKSKIQLANLKVRGRVATQKTSARPEHLSPILDEKYNNNKQRATFKITPEFSKDKIKDAQNVQYQNK